MIRKCEATWLTDTEGPPQRNFQADAVICRLLFKSFPAKQML